MSKIGQHRAF